MQAWRIGAVIKAYYDSQSLCRWYDCWPL